MFSLYRLSKHLREHKRNDPRGYAKQAQGFSPRIPVPPPPHKVSRKGILWEMKRYYKAKEGVWGNHGFPHSLNILNNIK
jgi:hypothetical protein